ncbi:MAG: linear amide C-N hydrolase [Saccharofermentans sp.]|nr:linear amide C-N hydrolase [Saccharofermentans sp.]
MGKRNKKAIIITAAVMFTGILLTLAGFFGNWFFGLFTKSFDYRNIQPEDLGKNIETDIYIYYENIDLPDKVTQFVGDLNGDGAFILVDLSALSESDKEFYYSYFLHHVTVTGTLRAMDDAEFQELTESLYRFYDPVFEERTDNKLTLEEFHRYLLEPYIPYCIEINSIGSFNWTPFIPAGIIIFLLSLVLEICFVFKLKKRFVLPVVYGLMIIIPTVMLFNHIRTILSVKKVTDGVYTMKNLECTDTGGMLDSGSGSVTDLINWIMDNHLYGVNINFDESNFRIGCAAFAATTPEGDHLFGRNFDYPETDIVLIHSNPEGAYESIGIADLGVLGVGQTYPLSPDSPIGKMYMVITPYLVVDGINEKGVGAGILELNMEETHQDNGKPDLLIFCAIRGILDNCASVDEALAFLDSYDIQSDLNATYHLFLTDRTGRYVVVEWLGNEMVVTEQHSCTNSVIAPGEYYDMGDPDERINIIDNCLGPDGIVSEQEAMQILDNAKSEKLTEWSCVYNLENFTVNICIDTDYEHVYTFSVGELR